jgi:hypothetical protein
MDTTIKYINLKSLARQTGLPNHYLKALAEDNSIPSLRISGRLRFNLAAVQSALDKLAEQGVSDAK